MSDGAVSEKFGKRSISDMCDIDEKITKITMSSKAGRLVGLVFES